MKVLSAFLILGKKASSTGAKQIVREKEKALPLMFCNETSTLKAPGKEHIKAS